MKPSLAVAALVGCLTACGPTGTDAPSSSATGRAQLSMTGTGTDGVAYRIVGWTLRFVGPQTLIVPEAETDPSAAAITVPLKVGSYTVALEGEWHVERADQPGVAVEVTLVTPNPLGFAVQVDEDSPLRFIFKLPADGMATVTMGVDSGGWISGTMDVQSVLDPRETHAFDDLGGRPITFTLSYDASHVTRAAGETLIETGPATLQFGGTSAFLAGELGPALSGLPLRLEMGAMGGNVLVNVDPLLHMAGPAMYELGLGLFPVAGGPLDPGGSPRLGTYVIPAQLNLRKDDAVVTATGLVTVEAR